ncbi:aldolase/citrate lyase family protein [Escherichia coli]
MRALTGVQAFDTVYSDANNEAGFLQEAAHIKQLGFDGKSLINPRQIDLLHNLYAPTQKKWIARRVVEAAEAAAREGLGVVSLNGRMRGHFTVIDRARLVCPCRTFRHSRRIRQSK